MQLVATAATSLVSAATLASLVRMLRQKAVLSTEEERELYEGALLMLEEAQGEKDPLTDAVYRMAREIIEVQLRR